MKTSNVLLLISVLLYINASTEWPTHTVCKEDNLEIYYKSCARLVAIKVPGEGTNNQYSFQPPEPKYETGCTLSELSVVAAACHQSDTSASLQTTSSLMEASKEEGGNDPQQDFSFSIDRCSDITTHTFDVKAAMTLRHSIKELYVKLAMIINGKTVLTYSDTLCGPGHSKLIFCGKKKGERLQYEGPVTLGIKEIPQGDYTLSAKLTNEDDVTVACAEFTVKNYLDYY